MRNCKALSGLCLAALVFFFATPGSAHAAAHKDHADGGVKTKIDFKLLTFHLSTVRLFGNFAVSTSVLATLPPKGTPSKNDELAGLKLTLTIGSAAFSGIGDAKGKVNHAPTSSADAVGTPYDAKLTHNGLVLQVKGKAINLQTLMGLNITDGEHVAVVHISLVATDPATGKTYALFNHDVTFVYDVNNHTIKGKNFTQ